MMLVGGTMMLGLGVGILLHDAGAGLLVGLGLGLVLQAFLQHKSGNRPPQRDD